MLAADKQALESVLQQQSLQIREKELRFFVENFAAVAGQAAMLAGFSEIGEGAILGMGAIVAPKVRVGPWSTVMINSAVVADVPASTACGGVPSVSFGPTERTNVGGGRRREHIVCN